MEVFGNLDLARIIEKESADDDAFYALAMKQLHPQQSFEVFEFPGGSSLFVGNSPFTNTHGFGTDKKSHTADLLNKIETFFPLERFPARFPYLRLLIEKSGTFLRVIRRLAFVTFIAMYLAGRILVE